MCVSKFIERELDIIYGTFSDLGYPRFFLESSKIIFEIELMVILAVMVGTVPDFFFRKTRSSMIHVIYLNEYELVLLLGVQACCIFLCLNSVRATVLLILPQLFTLFRTRTASR